MTRTHVPPATAPPTVWVHGLGAVSPAGWGVSALRQALQTQAGPAPVFLPRPGADATLRARRVPAPDPRPAWLGHPRLRRASAISHFTVSAGLEALGADAARVTAGTLRLGVVECVMTGSVTYSRRFYDEVLRDPALASPMLFPETVFNAPASHLAAVLGATGLNYTLVGDPSAFLVGLALAAGWLEDDAVDACVVVGAEEADWATAEALRLFSRGHILAEGAGAVYLRREPIPGGLALERVTDPSTFLDRVSQADALRQVRAEVAPEAGDLVCDGTTGAARADAPEEAAWRDWPGARLAPKRVLGEGLMAGAAWQCVSALDALRQNGYPAAVVSVPGCNHAAVAARFKRVTS